MPEITSLSLSVWINSCYQRTKGTGVLTGRSHRPRALVMLSGLVLQHPLTLSSAQLEKFMRAVHEHKSASVRPLPTGNGEKSRAAGSDLVLKRDGDPIHLG